MYTVYKIFGGKCHISNIVFANLWYLIISSIFYFSSFSILSLLTAIKGSPCEFDLFAFGRALSSQPTPYQVLKIKISKTTKSPLLTIPQKTVPFLDSLSLSCILFKNSCSRS